MFPHTIRTIHPEDDAAEIAALIRRCFKPWLEQENIDFLDRMGREGLYAAQHPFLAKFSSFPYQLEGVVCRDQRNSLLGVINAYYFHLNGQRCCLIANVCVDPQHRNSGIASRMLTEIERIQAAEGIRDLYLQARLAMPETVEFYRKRGYRVTDYRENLVYPKMKDRVQPGKEYRLERVPASDLPVFRRLMKVYYPPTVLWNLNYKEELFRTGTLQEILNRLDGSVNRFRRVVRTDGSTAAWAAGQHLSGFADWLWWVPNENCSGSERTGILKYLAASYGGKKPLKIDIPAGEFGKDCKKAGFRYWQTLAWMWKRL